LAKLRLEKYNEALADCKKSLELEGKNAAAYNNLGLIYQQLKNNSEAEKAFNKAIELAPTNTEYAQNLANLKQSSKDK